MPSSETPGTASTAAVAPPALPVAAPAESGLRKFGMWLGPAVSVAMLIAVVVQLPALNRGTDWPIPTSPMVWLVFFASYMAGPMADWLIFRRLWGIPFSGIVPLLRKLIGNELLLGYVGEVYFYDWARRHVKMQGSPFGAVKDVAILSALAGNIMTIAMLAATWPLISKLGFGSDGNWLVASIGVVLATSLAIALFRNGLLSLPPRDLWFVFMIHVGRIVVNTGFNALVWHLILPSVGMGPWLLLSTVRLLISRLPFVPNKDLAFAGISALLAGSQVQTGVMIAMISMLIVATHVVLFFALLLLDLIKKEKIA